MAGFSDAQIQMAANQMEMMASNPQMMKGMVEQMKNMSDAELEQVKRMQAGGAPPAPAAGGQNPMDMTPEQLKQQAEMMKSMDTATLRRMNPAMANWSDQQIQMAISQMETMANNPEMVNTMKKQMEGMKPEEIENLRKLAESGQMPGADAAGGLGINTGGTSAGTPAMPSDPMDMLNNANPDQIKSMLKMVKNNPQMMKDMLRSANPAMAQNMTDEQIEKTINTFANLDDRKIGLLVKALGFVQSVRNSPKMKIAIFMMISLFVFVVGMLIYLVRQQKSLDESNASLVEEIPEVPIIEESEF